MKRKELHNEFNKNLPLEIIEKIVTFLNERDLWNLAISKLFVPALFSLPYFYKTIQEYFIHYLCSYFTSKKNMYITCTFYPVIDNSYLYLSFNELPEIIRKRLFHPFLDLGWLTSGFEMLFSSYSLYRPLQWKPTEDCSCQLYIQNISTSYHQPYATLCYQKT